MASDQGGGRTAALSILGLGSQQIASFVITILAATFLSVSEYGVYTLAVVFAEFVILLTYTGYFHFTVNSEAEDDAVLSTMFWIMVGIGTAGGAVMCLGAPAVARFFDAPDLEPVLVAFGLLQPFASAIGWATAALTRAGLMRRYFLSIGASNLGALAVGAALLVLWQSVFALVAFRVTRILLGLCFYGLSVPSFPKLRFDRALAGEATRYSVGLYGSSLLTFFANFGTDLVLAGVFSTAEAGLYRFANRLAQATVEIVAQPYRSFALRHFGRAARDRDDLTPLFAQFMGFGALTLGGFGATLFVLGPAAVEILFRPEYAAGIVAMQALCVRAAARIGQLMIQPVFATRKRTYEAFYYNLALTSAILGSIAIFAPVGLEALAIAQATVQVMSVPVAIWVVRRWAGLDVAPALRQLGLAVALVLLYGVSLWLSWHGMGRLGLPAPWHLALAAGSAALLAALLLRYAARQGLVTLAIFRD